MKMNLHETIRLLIKEQGKNVVGSPTFMGMLDDYGAFREEEPATKTIVRELVRTGQMQRFIDSPNKGRNLHFEVRTIVSETARSGGFREDLVSDTLKRIALGTGKIHKEQDWPTLNEEKGGDDTSTQVQNQPVLTTEELSPEEWNAVLKSMNAVSVKSKSADPFARSAEKKKPSKHSVKVSPPRITTTRPSAKPSVRLSFWKRVEKWFTRHLEDLLFWAFIICVLLAVVTLIQTIYWLVVGPPDVAEAKAWEFLICTICAVVMWFVNE